jgi:hypothetical protein
MNGFVHSAAPGRSRSNEISVCGSGGPLLERRRGQQYDLDQLARIILDLDDARERGLPRFVFGLSRSFHQMPNRQEQELASL